MVTRTLVLNATQSVYYTQNYCLCPRLQEMASVAILVIAEVRDRAPAISKHRLEPCANPASWQNV
jgi:hypothetical protein